VLLRDARVYFEVATSACVVGVVPPGVRPDVGRVIDALHALAPDDPEIEGDQVHQPIPEPGPPAMLPREAAFAASEVVAARDAVGRVSAAYPPGIPNLMPGEVITAETVDFLQRIGSAPSGLVRGALDPAVTRLSVVR
jgi:lysine decarboxylase